MPKKQTPKLQKPPEPHGPFHAWRKINQVRSIVISRCKDCGMTMRADPVRFRTFYKTADGRRVYSTEQYARCEKPKGGN